MPKYRKTNVGEKRLTSIEDEKGTHLLDETPTLADGSIGEETAVGLQVEDKEVISYGSDASHLALQKKTLVKTICEHLQKQNMTKSPLLKLIIEVRMKILAFAVQLDHPVTPYQLCAGSNKFVYLESQCHHESGFKHMSQIKTGPTLAAVQLSLTCMELYKNVCLSHLFYQVNHFDLKFQGPYRYYFSKENVCCPYLFAITTPRLNSIRSLTFYWTIEKANTKILLALALLEGLKTLELRIPYNSLANIDPKDFKKTEGFAACVELAHGLSDITITIMDLSSFPTYLRPENADTVKVIEGYLRRETKKARNIGKKSLLANFASLKCDSALDVHGDGRISGDLKPDIISSRTREGKRKEGKLTEEGRLPEREIPKYDNAGYFAWEIYNSTGFRITNGEENGLCGVEFQVVHQFGRRVKYSTDPENGSSWEDASVLVNTAQNMLVMFDYCQTRYDSATVLKLLAWLKENVSKDGHRRHFIHRLESLSKYRERILERAQAKEEDKQARLAAKIAKKANQHKAK